MNLPTFDGAKQKIADSHKFKEWDMLIRFYWGHRPTVDKLYSDAVDLYTDQFKQYLTEPLQSR